MKVTLKELKFVATAEKGYVSALYAEPETVEALLVLGHGAGTHMQHSFMQDLSNALNQAKIATFRFNYPYSEKGGGMDGEKVRLATVCAAVTTANNEVQELPIFAGGHSMSGRMVSMACAQGKMDQLKGIILFAFPLYSSKPSTERAEHLNSVIAPMLFLSGQRDKMANLKLLRPVVEGLDQATLHIIDTADHSFKTLKRRNTDEPVMNELARISASWMLEKT